MLAVTGCSRSAVGRRPQLFNWHGFWAFGCSDHDHADARLPESGHAIDKEQTGPVVALVSIKNIAGDPAACSYRPSRARHAKAAPFKRYDQMLDVLLDWFGDIISYSAQLLCRYFPTALRRVSTLRSSARVSSSDISGENVSTTPCRPTTLGSDNATP
jgi:hypothetical protein